MKKPAAKKAKKPAGDDDEEESEEEEADSDQEGDVAAGQAEEGGDVAAEQAEKASDEELGPEIAMSLVKGPWTGIRQGMIMSRLPKAAQPQSPLSSTAKSYTLSNPLHETRIQVILDKPIYYVKGASADKIKLLSDSFGVKFKVDKFGGATVPLRTDPYGAFAHAMALAGWKYDDLKSL